MPKYTLNYFPSIGRAEPVRLMFIVAGVEFTDNQLSDKEWEKVKNNSKFFFSIFYPANDR